MIIVGDATNYCGWQIQINGIIVEEITGEHDEEIAKAKEDAIAFKKDYAYYRYCLFYKQKEERVK